MSKLQSVLNDEESMKQIKELAGMLGGSLNETEQTQNDAQPLSQIQQPEQTQNNSSPDFSQLISNLSGMLGGGSNQNTSSPQPETNPLGGIDMNKIAQLSTVMAQAKKSDKNVELLLALRPMLKEENQVKIDRVIKIFKLFAIYPALKESGLLGGDLFGLL